MNAASRNSIILFDGVCVFCNRTVQFLVRQDTRGRFKFGHLQSPEGQELLRKHGLPTDYFDSVVLIENGRVFTRSTAGLRIYRRLGGLWALLYVFMLVPAGLRDRVYDFIGANRYRIFGRSESCILPTPELKKRLLSPGATA